MATVAETTAAAHLKATATETLPQSEDAEFRNALRELLPEPITWHGGAIDALQAPLQEIEALSVRGAIERRVREFTAGRTCARTALKRLGFEDPVIPVGKRRQPVWPQGITGSISHASGYCLAAVSPRTRISGLGIDIEQASALSGSLIDLVCTPDEKQRFACSDGSVGLLAKIAFSAKEAVFKCLFPVYGEELEFHDVSLDLALHDGRFIAHVSRFSLNADSDLEVHGRFTCTSRLVISAAVLQDEAIVHLTGWNAESGMQRCAGKFICTSGHAQASPG